MDENNSLVKQELSVEQQNDVDALISEQISQHDIDDAHTVLLCVLQNVRFSPFTYDIGSLDIRCNDEQIQFNF